MTTSLATPSPDKQARFARLRAKAKALFARKSPAQVTAVASVATGAETSLPLLSSAALSPGSPASRVRQAGNAPAVILMASTPAALLLAFNRAPCAERELAAQRFCAGLETVLRGLHTDFKSGAEAYERCLAMSSQLATKNSNPALGELASLLRQFNAAETAELRAELFPQIRFAAHRAQLA